MAWAILDTNIYISHWERGLHTELLATIRQNFIVRQSSVVLSELRRGARAADSLDRVTTLIRSATEQWAPTATDWVSAGALVLTLADRHDWDINKRRELQNDALIALTARRHEATVVTDKADDFERLGRQLGIRVLT